MLFFSIYDEK